MMNVGKSITWNAALYDAKHNFVYTFGEDLLRLLEPQEGEIILDLGCGTGHLTSLIQRRCAHVVGIDNSEEMIAQAKISYPQINFQQVDACNMPWYNEFDAIFSNAVLHWILQRDSVISCMYNCLKPGGRLILEMGGRGNIHNIISSIRTTLASSGYTQQSQVEPWYFPSVGEYASLLERAGLTVKFALHFQRDTELSGEEWLKDWVEMFGHYFFEGVPQEEIPRMLEDVKEQLRTTNLKGGKWFAFYQRLRIIAYK